MELSINIEKSPYGQMEIYDCRTGEYSEEESHVLKIGNELAFWYARLDGLVPDRIAFFEAHTGLVLIGNGLHVLDLEARKIKAYYRKEHGLIDLMNHPNQTEWIYVLREGGAFLELVEFNEQTIFKTVKQFAWHEQDEQGFCYDVHFTKIIACKENVISCRIQYENHQLEGHFRLYDLKWINKKAIEAEILGLQPKLDK